MREQSKLLLSIVDAVQQVVGSEFEVVAVQDCNEYRVGVWCDLKNKKITVYLVENTIVPFRIEGDPDKKSDKEERNN